MVRPQASTAEVGDVEATAGNEGAAGIDASTSAVGRDGWRAESAAYNATSQQATAMTCPGVKATGHVEPPSVAFSSIG